MQRYESYKDSGVEWLGELPSHWEVRKVKHIFQLVVEPAPKNNSQELLSVYSNIGVKPRAELEERGNKASTTDGYWVVKKGDIIVNKLLAWMGAIGLSDYNGITSPAYDVLRPYQKIDGKFFHYLFRTNLCLSEFKKKSRGIMDMRLRLYFEELGNIFVPFPEYSEQQRIAQYLDAETTKVEQAISLTEKQIELLKEHKQILIQSAVTKGLDSNVAMKDSGVEWIEEVPAHWEIKKLKFISKINQRTLPENTNDKMKIKYVDIGSVSFSNGIEKVEDFLFKNAPSRARRLANVGDIIISTVRTYLKAITIVDDEHQDCVFSTGFAVITPNKILENKFFELYAKSDAFTRQVDTISKGMNYPAINSTDLSNLLIVVPPLPEQQKIVQYLDDKTEKIDHAISLKHQHIEKLKEYKNVLINDVVTGKVKV